MRFERKKWWGGAGEVVRERDSGESCIKKTNIFAAAALAAFEATIKLWVTDAHGGSRHNFKL